MRSLSVGLIAFFWAMPLQAHFVWIIPDAAKNQARVVMSESPEADSPSLLDKIAHTEVMVRRQNGRVETLKLAKGDEALETQFAGEGAGTLAGVCRYGVLDKGTGGPFLLMYYAKAELPRTDAAPPVHEPWDRLPLEIVTPQGPSGRHRVLWNGKPLAKAEVVVIQVGVGAQPAQDTDADGCFSFRASKPGVYGIRARHIDAKPGEHEGKAYKEVRHYSTLTLCIGDENKAAPAEEPVEDEAASRLLSQARAARAFWQDFPGFEADMEINRDGQVQRGTLRVDERGKIRFDGVADPDGWANRILASLVGHRMDNSAEKETPCAFDDHDERHPLGRAIRVLTGELHSSYRIRDNQIIVVNRTMNGSRFTITVLENVLNENGKYLPTNYLVNYWDAKTNALQRSEGHHQSWKRLGDYDLPVTVRVTTAVSGTGENAPLSTRSITLSKHRLAAAASR